MGEKLRKAAEAAGQTTKKRFAVAYEDSCDQMNRGIAYYCAYDWEHAEEKFYDSADSDGWVVTSVKLAPLGQASR